MPDFFSCVDSMVLQWQIRDSFKTTHYLLIQGYKQKAKTSLHKRKPTTYVSLEIFLWLTNFISGPPSLHVHSRERVWQATSFSTATAWKPLWRWSVLIVVGVFHPSLVTGFCLWEVDHSDPGVWLRTSSPGKLSPCFPYTSHCCNSLSPFWGELPSSISSQEALFCLWSSFDNHFMIKQRIN